MNAVKKTGFWITSLMFRMTSTKTRSSLRASAGITEQTYANKSPATSPVATVAAPRTAPAPFPPLFCVMSPFKSSGTARTIVSRRTGMRERPRSTGRSYSRRPVGGGRLPARYGAGQGAAGPS
ncbi:hypothetical protein GCM10017674_33660 [Streptomyces gardneri]|uniref:Uncharacterized protein n=1 Tax=Streptomyces gardneri TaxID=66892 RepID=A0A4Y3RFK6_9ACTN|nr:hypothetical protein SGA01_18290 [Streptomyces gardneri]GHG99210.1 hypothetical protein GCM10017674_33660 [Streptomyces gardneri]